MASHSHSQENGHTNEGDQSLDSNVHDRDHIPGVPDHGFRVKLNHRFPKKGKPFQFPRLHQLPSFIGLSFRYIKQWYKIKNQGKKMFIDIRDAVPLQQIYGVPLGGIGCGSIGRGFRGEFGRFQMIPGMYKWKTIPADQFLVTIRQGSETIYQNVLSSNKGPSKELSSWKWEFEGANATYHGLYPRAWTVFNISEYKIKLICRQISPIIPHEYQESSLPTAIFVWDVVNNSADDLSVSITLAFQNGVGRRGIDNAGGVWNQNFHYSNDDGQSVRGVSINQKLKDMDCSYLLSARVQDGSDVSLCNYFNPNGNGGEIWEALSGTGQLKSQSERSKTTSPGVQSGAAICVKLDVPKRSKCQTQICLAWHMPRVRFGGGANLYERRYVRWFDGERAGERLSLHALLSYPSWEEKIEEWQNPVLNSSLPSWYKSAIFNELYFVSDGGTVWLDNVDSTTKSRSPDQLVNDFGKFAYLEGHEYRMYNTYDVHFYASFALIMNWPKLQLSLQYDIAKAIKQDIPTVISYIHCGKTGPIKELNCVPHDIGDPEDEPWTNINSYTIHPTADWKDLNPKFVLQVMRDFHITDDKDYLYDMFPTVLAVMDRSLLFDTDGDGMIENGGYPDQTYDTWTATGTSAYCGGLWLAALRVTVEMCELVESNRKEQFEELLARAAESYDSKLWNGTYYNYDSSKSSHARHIMSDMLCGPWYLASCGIRDESVFPREKIHSALRTIYENNVLRFGGGEMGAINGCKPDGKPDLTTVQSEEFWTGVSYALSANLLQEGMLNEAFKTSYGVYKEVYELRGLAYQTPEAYMDNETYRSLGYMRPLSIWSIQWAIDQYHPGLLRDKTVGGKTLDGEAMDTSKPTSTEIPLNREQNGVLNTNADSLHEQLVASDHQVVENAGSIETGSQANDE